MTLSLSRMASAENSAKDSAQSPACRRNACPAATCPSDATRRRASPANTNGGRAASSFRTCSSPSSSGHSGCCAAGSCRQRWGLHSAGLMGLQRKCSAPTLVTCEGPPVPVGMVRCGRACASASSGARSTPCTSATWWRRRGHGRRSSSSGCSWWWPTCPGRRSARALVTPAEQRFLVVEAAVAGVEGVEACRMEIDRGGPSYSADTVDELLGSVPSGAALPHRGRGRGRRARDLAAGGRAP